MIVVGDMHATPTELQDCWAVIRYLIEMRKLDGEGILFMGDQFHTHNILRLEVVDFWRSAIIELKRAGHVVRMLKGNHDMATSGMGPNALESFADMIELFDKAEGGYVINPHSVGVALPYIHGKEEFVAAAIKLKERYPQATRLFCHQTFDGAQYDNGFFASDGVDQNLVPFDEIISGHIHRAATLGKVTYVGSPRWRTASDANIDKFVYRLDGRELISYPTDALCRRIVSRDILEGQEIPEFSPHHDVRVTLRGRREWIQELAPQLELKGIAVSRIPDAVAAPRVSESMPVEQSFQAFLASFKTPNATAKEALLRVAAEYL